MAVIGPPCFSLAWASVSLLSSLYSFYCSLSLSIPCPTVKESTSKMEPVQNKIDDEISDGSDVQIIFEKENEPTLNAINNFDVKSDPATIEFSQDSGVTDLSLTTSQLLHPSEIVSMGSQQSQQDIGLNFPDFEFLDNELNADNELMTPCYEPAVPDFWGQKETEEAHEVSFLRGHARERQDANELQIPLEDDVETFSQAAESIEFLDESPQAQSSDSKQRVLEKQIVGSIEEEGLGVKFRVDFFEATVKKRDGEMVKTLFTVPSIIDEMDDSEAKAEAIIPKKKSPQGKTRRGGKSGRRTKNLKSFEKAGQLGLRDKSKKVKKTGISHVCSLCGKSYGDKFSLDRHFKIHAGDVKCGIGDCEAKYNNKTTLTKHRIESHGLQSSVATKDAANPTEQHFL